MFDRLLDIMFPQDECCICHKTGKYSSRKPWCSECQDNLLTLQCCCSTCEICGKYLPEGGNLCMDCQHDPPSFDIARAVGPYVDPYRMTTKVLKFMGRKNLSIRMGEMMAEKVKEEPRYKHIDLIVPVPISWSSLQQRGFNQTELLACQISKHLGIPTDSRALCRIKDTPSQTGLSKEERQQNVCSAFKASHPSKIKGKHILLVDDVFTTGSTSRECTRALLEAGAARVCVITWASGKGL